LVESTKNKIPINHAAIVLVFYPTIFDSDIATLDKAVLEADLKCSEALLCQPKG
jgi:hypothetical protein